MIDDVRLPDEIEQGSTGGPTWSTSVTTVGSGHEARNQNWQQARCVYDISYGVMTADDGFADVVAFYRARRGRLRGFRFKDWADFIGVGQALGNGDGTVTTFQLVKLYPDAVSPYLRTITWPVNGTVVVYANGVQVNNWTMGAMGVITFQQAPGAGVAITADFEFDVPVRFDSDVLTLTFYQANAADVQSINLIEVLDDEND